MHKVELLDQEPVVRGKVYLLVKLPVRHGKGIGIVKMRPIRLDQPGKYANLLRRSMLRRQTRCQRLKLDPHGIKLGRLRMIERGDHKAPPPPHQKRLRLQPLQRLADGRAADTKTLGYLGLDQTVIGPVDADVDGLKDEVVGVGLWSSFAHRSSVLRLAPGVKGWTHPARQRSTLT